jgi:dCTP deaminase
MLPPKLSGCIPGVLSNRQLGVLCEEGWIERVTGFDLSSIDLTLGDEAYLMSRGSVKPFGEQYSHFLDSNQDSCIPQKADAGGVFQLKKKNTYVFALQQCLGRKLINDGSFYGQATAKSSVGRVDVLARLIVEGMDCYEYFNEKASNGNGRLFLEITPITFNVLVKVGTSLSQLRIFYGNPDHAALKGKELFECVNVPDGDLRVDLNDIRFGEEQGCTFCASSDSEAPIPLWREAKVTRPQPQDYWSLAKSVLLNGKRCLQIKKEQFYLLRSKEMIALPAGIAVYCRAIDETIGEMRIHYAGFVHPWFGRTRKDGGTGTPLIFEVRGHDVEVLLTDQEKMARLSFYRMSEACKQPQATERGYGDQILELSHFFADWNSQPNADVGDKIR